MAHFAELDTNNVVKQVIVVADKDTSDELGTENEEIGVAYLKGLFGENTKWKQTSYNGNIRKRYAGRGFAYNEEYDVFISPSPFPSWTLSTETLDWEAPISRPEETEEMTSRGQFYVWDEENYNIGSNGWTIETIFTPPALEESESTESSGSGVDEVTT